MFRKRYLKRALGHVILSTIAGKGTGIQWLAEPKQSEPCTRHTNYFKNYIIEGSVDFIFGGAESYFDDCEFCSIEKVSFFALNIPEGADDASRPSWIKVTNEMEVE